MGSSPIDTFFHLKHARRAAVVYVDRPVRLIEQAKALYQSLLYSQAPDTDLVCFGPRDALAQMPEGPQLIKCVQEPHVLAPQYGFINSISCFNGTGHEILNSYAYLLKTDVDTFLTPAWRQFSLKGFACGAGAYVHSQDVRERLHRLSQQFGYTHRGRHNLGSTLWGPPALMKSVCLVACELTQYLITVEFAQDKGVWPHWYRGVSSMYATEVALNHFVPDLIELHDNLDYPSTSTESITKHPHIHCWHTRDDYSKFKWIEGHYVGRTQDQLNVDVIRDYCLTMALRAQAKADS